MLGIDIGGSGIKGAPVDLIKGEFAAERVRIDTPGEANYYRNGGIMQYVLRSLRGTAA